MTIAHEKRTLLVHGSANYRGDALAGQRVEVIYLGIGGLGLRSDGFVRSYWKEVVQATRAKRVILVHWDGFFGPERPLRPEIRLRTCGQPDTPTRMGRRRRGRVAGVLGADESVSWAGLTGDGHHAQGSTIGSTKEESNLPDFYSEPFLCLAGLTHKSVLVAWGAFYFRVKDSGEEFKLVDDNDLKHVHPPRKDSIGASSKSYGPATVEVFDAVDNLVATAATNDAANHCWVVGLTPDTEYTYRVMVNGEEWASGPRRNWEVAGDRQVSAPSSKGTQSLPNPPGSDGNPRQGHSLLPSSAISASV